MSGADIARLRALLAAGTAPPWTAKRCDYGMPSDEYRSDGIEDARGDMIAETDSGVYGPSWNDAALIAAAVNSLAKLLDGYEAAMAVVRAVANAPGQDGGAWHQPCGLCAMQVYNPNVQHAPGCAWVAARGMGG